MADITSVQHTTANNTHQQLNQTQMSSLADEQSAEQLETDFLRLIIAEMQHQDPLDPMKDREFVAQMAQIQNMKELRMMQNAVTTQHADSLLGKIVSVIHVPTGSDGLESGTPYEIVGRVTSVQQRNGQPHIMVEGDLYPVSRMIAIHYEPETPSQSLQQPQYANEAMNSLQTAMQFLNRNIRVYDGNINAEIEGTVTEVQFVQGIPGLLVNGRLYPVQSVTAILGTTPSADSTEAVSETDAAELAESSETAAVAAEAETEAPVSEPAGDGAEENGEPSE